MHGANGESGRVGGAERGSRARRGAKPRIAAAGFLVAFAASTLTLIYTGLLVRAPGADGSDADSAGQPAEPESAAAAGTLPETGDTDPREAEAAGPDGEAEPEG